MYDHTGPIPIVLRIDKGTTSLFVEDVQNVQGSIDYDSTCGVFYRRVNF
jgi:hypothetical protein